MKQNKNEEKRREQKTERTKKIVKEELKKNRVLTAGGAVGPAARLMNKEMHRAAKVTVVRTPKYDSYSRWIQALANPFSGRSISCPINYAPSPSLISTTCTVTNNRVNFTVAAGKTTQIVLFPGHCSQPRARAVPLATGSDPAYYPMNVSAVDSTSFHQRLINMKRQGVNNAFSVGPLKAAAAGSPSHTVEAAIGGFIEDLNAGGASVACTNWTAIQPDVDVPYRFELGGGVTPGVAEAAATAHCRWKLDSMGIRIMNSTPEATRGGSIQSVQIANSSGFSGNLIANSEINPSFRLWDTFSGQLSWVPRFQDLAYWHSIGAAATPGSDASSPPLTDANAFQLGNEASAIVIWLTAGSTAQTYSWEIIQNYTLAGPLVNSIGGPSTHMPEKKTNVEHVITSMQNFAHSADVAPKISKAVDSALNSGREYVASLAVKAAKIAGGAIMTSAGFV